MKTKNTKDLNPVVFTKRLATAHPGAWLAVGLLFLPFLVAPLQAQKGVGDSTGIARQAVKPALLTLSGRLLEIKTGTCEAATGRSLIGTHLLLETSTQEILNIHLGPAAVVADIVAALTVGHPLLVQAFRTEAMKENHYVAQSLTFNQTTVELRDASLRPFWARSKTGALTPSAGSYGAPEAENPMGGGRGRGWRGGR